MRRSLIIVTVCLNYYLRHGLFHLFIFFGFWLFALLLLAVCWLLFYFIIFYFLTFTFHLIIALTYYQINLTAKNAKLIVKFAKIIAHCNYSLLIDIHFLRSSDFSPYNFVVCLNYYLRHGLFHLKL